MTSNSTWTHWVTFCAFLPLLCCWVLPRRTTQRPHNLLLPFPISFSFEKAYYLKWLHPFLREDSLSLSLFLPPIVFFLFLSPIIWACLLLIAYTIDHVSRVGRTAELSNGILCSDALLQNMANYAIIKNVKKLAS